MEHSMKVAVAVLILSSHCFDAKSVPRKPSRLYQALDRIDDLRNSIRSRNEESSAYDNQNRIGSQVAEVNDEINRAMIGQELGSKLDELSEMRERGGRGEEYEEEQYEGRRANARKPVNFNLFLVFDMNKQKDQARDLMERIEEPWGDDRQNTEGKDFQDILPDLSDLSRVISGEDKGNRGFLSHNGPGEEKELDLLSRTRLPTCTSSHKDSLKKKEKDGCAGAVEFATVACIDYLQCTLHEGKHPYSCRDNVCEKLEEMEKKDCFSEIFDCD
ncbi:hypothetical protein Y032_0391g565 [Ancylostoma ceylanicum]|uniref:Uncharacterized protein n=2 Tax=Ancylostoma ceylanicum TaxID=53326 RepID=A0A016RS76_9BILA|nr:hypothetical protein Y032_0391g565 [Ancylostoma ceylanicum]